MNGSKTHREIPDFRREDGIWVRTAEEKGNAFFQRFLQQTDQDNEAERVTLMRRLQYHYSDELTEPHEVIEKETLAKVISKANNSAPGPDGIKYADLKLLESQEMQSLADMLNDSIAQEL